jgi:hypothetical protein
VGGRRVQRRARNTNIELEAGPGPSYVETFMHANDASIGRFEFLFLPRSESGGVKSWNAGG